MTRDRRIGCLLMAGIAALWLLGRKRATHRDPAIDGWIGQLQAIDNHWRDLERVDSV